MTNSAAYRRRHERALWRRRRAALAAAGLQLAASLAGGAVGVDAWLYVTNVDAGAFWPHAVLGLASIISLIGVMLKKSGRSWMLAGMILNCLGVIMALVGAVVDGAMAAHILTTDFGKCEWRSESGLEHCGDKAGAGPGEDTWYSPLQPVVYACRLHVPPRTCVCCEVHRERHCDAVALSVSAPPDHYASVSSCEEVRAVYLPLLLASAAISAANFVFAIVADALVGRYRASFSLTVSPSCPAPIFMTNGAGPVIIVSGQSAEDLYPTYIPTTAILKPPDYADVIAGASSEAAGAHAPPVRMVLPEPLPALHHHAALEQPPPYAP